MNFMAAQRWLGARFQVLGSVAVLFAGTFVVVFNDKLKLETGLVAILIIWSSNVSNYMYYFCNHGILVHSFKLSHHFHSCICSSRLHWDSCRNQFPKLKHI